MLTNDDLRHIGNIVRAEVAPVKRDVALLKQDVAGVKEEVASVKTAVAVLDKKLDKAVEDIADMQREILIVVGEHHEKLEKRVEKVEKHLGVGNS